MGFFSDSVVLLMFRRPTGVSFLKSRRDAKALPRSDSVPMPITGLSDDHQNTFRCPSEIFPTGIRKSSDGHRNSVARGVTEEAESAARSDDSRRFGGRGDGSLRIVQSKGRGLRPRTPQSAALGRGGRRAEESHTASAFRWRRRGTCGRPGACRTAGRQDHLLCSGL